MEIIKRTIPEDISEFTFDQFCSDCDSELRIGINDLTLLPQLDKNTFLFRCPVCGYINHAMSHKLPSVVQRYIVDHADFVSIPTPPDY